MLYINVKEFFCTDGFFVPLSFRSFAKGNLLISLLGYNVMVLSLLWIYGYIRPQKTKNIVQSSVLDCNLECEKYWLFYPSLINYFQNIRCCHMWEDSAIYVLLCLVVLGATFIDGIVYIVQAAINPERVHCLFEFCNIVTCNWIYMMMTFLILSATKKH